MSVTAQRGLLAAIIAVSAVMATLTRYSWITVYSSEGELQHGVRSDQFEGLTGLGDGFVVLVCAAALLALALTALTTPTLRRLITIAITIGAIFLVFVIARIIPGWTRERFTPTPSTGSIPPIRRPLFTRRWRRES